MSQEPDDAVEYEVGMAPGQLAQVAAAIAPPLPPEPEFNVLDMDEVLAYTQKKRIRVVNAINKKLGEIEDPAMFSAMLKGLSDMDKGVVQRKRIGIEEEVAKTAEQSQRDTASLLRVITANAMQLPAGERPMRTIPTLPDEVSQTTLVPGETDQGMHDMSYDAFAQGVAGPK